MKNFTYHVPTRVIFGTDREREIGELLRNAGVRNVLILHGRQCKQCQGLYERVTKSLTDAGISYNDVGGIVPPATRDKANEAIALGRIEDVDYILALGGVSVINTAKAVAVGIPNEGDIWEYYEGKREPRVHLPVGVVVTTVAGGGEMSAIARLTNTKEKRTRHVYWADARPHLAIMNPMLTYTLPMAELQGGVAEIMLLTMERYFTHDSTMELTDNICEVLMRVLVRNAGLIMEEPNNYEARANVMWASALAHNDLTGCGNGWGDITVHELQRQLLGIYGIIDGIGLASLWCAWAHHVYRTDVHRFYRYGRTVWGLPRDFGSQADIAHEAILLTEQFFVRIGMLGPQIQERFKDIEFDIDQLTERAMEGKSQIGTFKALTHEDVRSIYERAVSYIKEGV